MNYNSVVCFQSEDNELAVCSRGLQSGKHLEVSDVPGLARFQSQEPYWGPANWKVASSRSYSEMVFRYGDSEQVLKSVLLWNKWIVLK